MPSFIYWITVLLNGGPVLGRNTGRPVFRYKSDPGAHISPFAMPLQHFHGLRSSAAGAARQAGLSGIHHLDGRAGLGCLTAR
jgi:hypothetical protein